MLKDMQLESLLIWCIANRHIENASDLENFFKGLFERLRPEYDYDLSISGIKADLKVNLSESQYHFNIRDFSRLRIEPILHGTGCRRLIGIGICFDVTKCLIIGHTDVIYTDISDHLKALSIIVDKCCNAMVINDDGLFVYYLDRSPVEVYDFVTTYGEKNVTKLLIDVPDPTIKSITQIFVNGHLLDEDRYDITLRIDKALPGDLYTEMLISSKKKHTSIRLSNTFKDIFHVHEQSY